MDNIGGYTFLAVVVIVAVVIAANLWVLRAERRRELHWEDAMRDRHQNVG